MARCWGRIGRAHGIASSCGSLFTDCFPLLSAAFQACLCPRTSDDSPPYMKEVVAQPTVVVGAGAVGSALARALHERGASITGIVSRTRSDAVALASRVGAEYASSSVTQIPPATKRVLICVPDQQLDQVAAELARASLSDPWIAAHTSGAHAAEVLAPLRAAGAALLSIHPLQTFTAHTPPSAFQGIWMTIEGDENAYGYGEALAKELGASPQHLESGAKPLYHLSAVLASNGFVALLATAQHVWENAGLEPDKAFDALRPLVERTWMNIQKNGSDALTGPAARGDHETIAAHIAALHTSSESPREGDVLPEEETTNRITEQNIEIERLYASLTNIMVQLQRQAGKLSQRDAARVQNILKNSLQKGRRNNSA